MGLFLSASGVIGSKSEEVKNALSEIATSRGGGFELSDGIPGEPNIGAVTKSGDNTTVVYPDGFVEWDPFSSCLSEMLKNPVFSFHIHDGDIWMVTLFKEGKDFAWFNPLPDYWGEVSDEEREKWKGDATLVSSVLPNVQPESIVKYFVNWSESSPGDKACPDDEYGVGNCWQMCDFMKKVGLDYPLGDQAKGNRETFKLWTKEFKRVDVQKSSPPGPKPESTKPWWKFW